MKQRISHTRIHTAAECARQFYFRYTLHLKPADTAPDLATGTFLHRVMADFFLTRKPLGDCYEERLRSLGETLALRPFGDTDEDYGKAKYRLDKFMRGLYRIEDKLRAFPPLVVEQRMFLPLSPLVSFEFQPDAVTVNDPTTLIELKTGQNPTPEQYLLLSVQHLEYLWALRELGRKGPYNVVYLLVDPAKAWIEPPFPVSDQMLDAAGRWIKEYKDPKEFRANYAPHCKWCPYNLICETELMGLPTEDVIGAFAKEEHDGD